MRRKPEPKLGRAEVDAEIDLAEEVISSGRAPLVEQPFIVTIDGPSGAGKSTIARRLANHFSVPFLDSGAIYRTLALVAEEKKIAWDDRKALREIAEGLEISFKPSERGDLEQAQRVVLLVREGGNNNGKVTERDITKEIRSERISMGASLVSQWPLVRKALVPLQLKIGSGGCVVEGRDTGTNLFPEASHKFVLVANLKTRVKRRLLQGKEESEGGLESVSEDSDEFRKLYRQMQLRDKRDRTRPVSPLVERIPGAVRIDATRLNQDEVFQKMVSEIEKTRKRENEGNTDILGGVDLSGGANNSISSR